MLVLWVEVWCYVVEMLVVDFEVVEVLVVDDFLYCCGEVGLGFGVGGVEVKVVLLGYVLYGVILVE